MRLTICAIAILIALRSIVISAAEPVVHTLPKSGPWLADYDVNSCRLTAKFGAEDQEVWAIFSRFSPGDEFQLSLVGQPLKRSEPQVQIKIAFGPNQPFRDAWTLTGTRAGKPLLLLDTQRLDGWEPPEKGSPLPPAISPEQEAHITQLTIQLKRSKVYQLGLGSMQKPMAEMRKCMDTLLKYWGYDPKVDATLTKRVTPIDPPNTWIRSADYPSKALLNGLQGIVQFRLDVDESGKVAGCRILSRTSPDEFADLSCRILTERARFEPALDAAGTPIKSYYVNRVRFIFGS